jgi:hypothetical protein
MTHPLHSLTRVALAGVAFAALALRAAEPEPATGVGPASKSLYHRVDVETPAPTAVDSGFAGYIPLIGTQRLRINPEHSGFDRDRLVGLNEFLERRRREHTEQSALPMADLGVLPELELPPLLRPQPNASRRTTAQQAAETAQARPQQPATVTGATAQSQVVLLGSDPSKVTRVSPDELLRYFEIRDRAQGTGNIGVPFVLPYQAQQPLIMDSKATYDQVPPPAESE